MILRAHNYDFSVSMPKEIQRSKLKAVLGTASKYSKQVQSFLFYTWPKHLSRKQHVHVNKPVKGIVFQYVAFRKASV